MSNITVPNPNLPDDLDVRVSIRTVERETAERRSPYQCEEAADRMIAYEIRRGSGGLGRARCWAIEAALHQDRQMTLAEVHASTVARAEYKAVAA